MSTSLSVPGAVSAPPHLLTRLRHLHFRDLALLATLGLIACVFLAHAWFALEEMRAEHQRSQHMIRLTEVALLVSAKADAARMAEADLNYALLADKVEAERLERGIGRFQTAQSDLEAAINALGAESNDDAWTQELLRILRGEQRKFVVLHRSAAAAIAGGQLGEQRLARTLLSEEGWRLAESVSALTQTITLNFSRQAAHIQLQTAQKVQALRWRIGGTVTLALAVIALTGWLSNRAWRATAASIQRLEHRALTDALTGLPNRRAFRERLDAEIAQAQRNGSNLVLAYLDLDHFKRFNDAHGHPAGDQLLRDAAKYWQAVLRPSDLIARIGGEEFAILMPGCSYADANACIERVRTATPQGQTFSSGVAQLDAGESADELIKRADMLLYRAKTAGRGLSVGNDTIIPGVSTLSPDSVRAIA